MKKLLGKYLYKRAYNYHLLLPAKPAKYLNPFLVCFMSQKKLLDKELGILPRMDIISKCRDDWKSYTDEQKAPYIEQSKILRWEWFDQCRYYDNHYNIRKYMIPKELIAVHFQMAKQSFTDEKNKKIIKSEFGNVMQNLGKKKTDDLSQTELILIDKIYQINQVRKEQIFHELSIYELPKLLRRKELVQNYVDSNILGNQMPAQTYREFLIQNRVSLREYDQELANLAESHKDTVENIELATAILVTKALQKVEEKSDFIKVLNDELA